MADGEAAPRGSVRAEWLARHSEDIIAPDRPIIDAHHHLGDKPKERYLLPELLADLSSGHNVRATVFMEWRSMYRAAGPDHLRSIGEVEFVNGIAAQAASGQYGPQLACAAIVGSADLSLGEAVEPVLEALIRAGNGRFRGIRPMVKWHADERIHPRTSNVHAALMRDPEFQRGARVLGRLGLSLDIWAYQTQLDDVVDLARAAPGTTIIVNHIGGPLGAGPYVGKRDEMFGPWRRALADLADLPNVVIKLGGLGVPSAGFGFGKRDMPPSSSELAEAWRPYFDVAVSLFGASRCMFESNFPVDKRCFSYAIVWNAFKRLAAGASEREQSALFSATAQTIYGIYPPLL